jgi:hypothetical protein
VRYVAAGAGRRAPEQVAGCRPPNGRCRNGRCCQWPREEVRPFGFPPPCLTLPPPARDVHPIRPHTSAALKPEPRSGRRPLLTSPRARRSRRREAGPAGAAGRRVRTVRFPAGRAVKDHRFPAPHGRRRPIRPLTRPRERPEQSLVPPHDIVMRPPIPAPVVIKRPILPPTVRSPSLPWERGRRVARWLLGRRMVGRCGLAEAAGGMGDGSAGGELPSPADGGFGCSVGGDRR